MDSVNKLQWERFTGAAVNRGKMTLSAFLSTVKNKILSAAETKSLLNSEVQTELLESLSFDTLHIDLPAGVDSTREKIVFGKSINRRGRTVYRITQTRKLFDLFTKSFLEEAQLWGKGKIAVEGEMMDAQQFFDYFCKNYLNYNKLEGKESFRSRIHEIWSNKKRDIFLQNFAALCRLYSSGEYTDDDIEIIRQNYIMCVMLKLREKDKTLRDNDSITEVLYDTDIDQNYLFYAYTEMGDGIGLRKLRLEIASDENHNIRIKTQNNSVKTEEQLLDIFTCFYYNQERSI